MAFQVGRRCHGPMAPSTALTRSFTLSASPARHCDATADALKARPMQDTDSLSGAPESEGPAPSPSPGAPARNASPARSALAWLTRSAHDIAIMVTLALLCLT